MNRELPGVQVGFRKGGGTRDQIANIHSIIDTIKWCGVTFLGGGDENVLKLIVAIYVNFVNTLKT